MKLYLGLLLAFLGAVACSSQGRGLAVVEVSAEPGIGPIEQLEVSVSRTEGGPALRTTSADWPPADGGTAETLGVFVPSDVSGTVWVTVVGKDAGGHVIAMSAPVQVKVEAGKTSAPVPVVLRAVTVQPDGGVPDGGIDAATGGQGGSGTGGAGGRATGGSPTGGSGGRGGAMAATGGVGGAATGGAQTGGAQTGGAMAGGAGGGSVATGGSVARKWTTAVNLQDGPGGTSLGDFDVAIAPTTGDAVVVWTDILGVRSLHYTAATNAWATSRVVLDERGVPREAHVGADGSGHFVAVWGQTPDGGQTDVKLGVFASRSSDGVVWTSPTLLKEGTVWGDIRLAVSRGGKARVVWDEQTMDTSGTVTIRSVYTAFFDGAAWGAAAAVKAGNDRYDRYARVAISDQGDGAIVWLEPDDTAHEDSTWAAIFKGATVGAAKLLETYDADVIEYPDVAVNASGVALASWIQRVSVSGAIRANLYVARLPGGATTWSAAERVARPDYAGQPMPALDSAGAAYLGWSQPDASDLYQLTVSTSAASGGTWMGTTPFETDDKAHAYTNQDLSPVVRVVSTTKDVLIAWRKRPADFTFGARVMWRSAAGTYSTPVDLGTYDKIRCYGMQASVTDDGRAAVAWTYYTGAKDTSPADYLSRSELPAASLPALAGVWVSLYR